MVIMLIYLHVLNKTILYLSTFMTVRGLHFMWREFNRLIWISEFDSQTEKFWRNIRSLETMVNIIIRNDQQNVCIPINLFYDSFSYKKKFYKRKKVLFNQVIIQMYELRVFHLNQTRCWLAFTLKTKSEILINWRRGIYLINKYITLLKWAYTPDKQYSIS